MRDQVSHPGTSCTIDHVNTVTRLGLKRKLTADFKFMWGDMVKMCAVRNCSMSWRTAGMLEKKNVLKEK